jgi:signal transduction histidine kinase
MMADDEFLIDPLVISNFIHQIISPLNGVVGTLDNVIDGTVKKENVDQRLKAVRAQLVHSIELIRNLAFLSQVSIDHGKLSLQDVASDVTVPAIIIEAALFFQERGGTRGVSIHLTDRDTQYRVKGHSALLRQVFMNLFDNAVKYADGDTRVVVSVRPQVRKRSLLVEVENIGPGFETSEREKIFERGYRSAVAKNIRASGTGLGLFIARRIIEDAHLARIEAEHSPALRKTTFRIRFPGYSIGETRGSG